MLPRYVRATLLAALLAAACAPTPADLPAPASGADLLIRGGTVYDGGGGAPYAADIVIAGDSILAVDRARRIPARDTLDAAGLAVAPGFVNMLSWGYEELLQDGRGESDLRQGVTLEIFGEGSSPGPVNERVAREMLARGDTVPQWEFGEALDSLVARGVSLNVASFVGATTVRLHELGADDRAPTPDELARMQALVRRAMEEGALGVGTSLIYPPASYSTTAELVALARAAAPYGGMYISHMRGEGDRLLEAADELIAIAREAGVPGEIYHIKAAGADNWGKFDALLAKVDSARRAGLRITADMYTYPASATGITSRFPQWAAAGGFDSLLGRLQDPAARGRVEAESDFRDPAGVLLVDFRTPPLRALVGRTLEEVARERRVPPAVAAMDLVVEDRSRVGVVFFSMAEENVRKAIRTPWVSFGSDGGAYTLADSTPVNATHPRAYGNFARLLGRYVREERLIPLEEAVRRLSALPAENLGLARRGRLAAGRLADVVVFDPATVADRATYERPHQYAVGVHHVVVNGVPALRDGQVTAARPGRVVRGRGAR
ncbi:MAG TPA: amidohydrolase family protein [Longimicrobium sp.]|nr:amidohydrolase family protein [Longimicrobium sp.]